MDVPQTVIVINRALMKSQAATTLDQARAQRAGRHHRLGRRRHDRQQHQPQRLLGAHRHLPRRHARPRPVLSRHVRARGDRGPDGPVLDAVRPRLDRRRHQPGDQEARAEAGDGTQRPGDDQRPHPHHRRRQHAVRRDQRGARQRHVPVGQGLDASTTPTSWTSASRRRSSSASARRPRSRCGAILQHRKDNVNYGVPPLNGFPINVPRNVNYGLSDDYTEQDVIQLNATVDHKFSGDLRLRNQSEFLWVNTSVRQTSGGFVGTLGPNFGFVQAAAGPNNTPYSGAPLNQLYIRQLSRDRNINDITLENQTEVEAKFAHRAGRPSAADGPRPQLRAATPTRLHAHRLLQQHPAGGRLGRLHAGRLHGRRRHAGQRAVDPGQLRTRRRPGASAPISTTRSRSCPG